MLEPGSGASPKWSASWSETDRLAALDRYRILDTPPEPAFDAIVALAAQICATPIAAISLVAAGRQWFKAEIGMGTHGTNLVVAICDDAIQLPGLVVIPNLAEDPRFRENPIVMGPPKLRFYAGAPLLTPDGLPLGMLCVLDDKPRHLTADQSTALLALADQVMAQLEMRRLLSERDAALSQKDLLVRELHHRVKNTLTTVQAVMSATARASTTLPEFQAAFAGRIGALANTHVLLTEHERQSASFADLVRAELKPYDTGAGGRVTLDGPKVILSSELAIPIGMALHELTSNAAKHGALADPNGRVVVCWQLTTTDEGSRLTWDWNEHDGPPVRLPTRQGFGTRLLDRVLVQQVGAKVQIDYEPDGLHVYVGVPLMHE